MLLTEEYCFICSCGTNAAQAPPKHAGNQPKKKIDFFWWGFRSHFSCRISQSTTSQSWQIIINPEGDIFNAANEI